MNLHKNSNPWLRYNQIIEYVACISTGNFIFQHDDATVHIAKAREYFFLNRPASSHWT